MRGKKLFVRTRQRLELTQEQMAKLISVSFVSVNRWEKGHTAPAPSIVELYAAIAKALDQGVSPMELLANVSDRTALMTRLNTVKPGSSQPHPPGGPSMPTTKYRCLNDACVYATPVDDSDHAAVELCKKHGFPSVADILSCPHCKDLWIEIQGPQPAPGEPYGVLTLACDLSGSMLTPLPNRKDKTRYDLVIDALAQLFQEFANTTVRRLAHYDRLLVSIIRYGANASIFELGGSPWFTVEQLATSFGWSVEASGLYNLEDIAACLRTRILPTPASPSKAVGSDNTNFEAAFEAVAEVASPIKAALDGGTPTLLPSNFRGLGPIPSPPGTTYDHRQWWLVTYSDGEPNIAYQGDPYAAARAKNADLAREYPQMHRITAFLGSEAAAARLMYDVASPCTLPAHADKRAYFDPKQAMRLRSIIHMATVTQSGLCPTCLEKHSSSTVPGTPKTNSPA